MIWYEIRKYDCEIHEVEVVKVTAKQVHMADGWRHFIHSAWSNFYPTWEEARDAILIRLSNAVVAAQERLQEASSEQAEVVAALQKEAAKRKANP